MAGTSLAEQLKKLAAPQTSILVHTKKRASLLFSPKDAADIDRETFYKIGLSGLEELKAIDPRLAEFEKSLFDEASQHLERAVEDRKVNAKLDHLINRFLILLSPYLNLNASHKTLEWLICRFHIHQYNIDSILALFLPYHDTNVFARMVQILPVQDRGGRWVWLEPLKKEGIPMSKLFLLSRASTDTSFFKFICSLPLQAVQVHGDKSVCLTTMFAFYCTTVIGALHQCSQVSEVHISHLLPSLVAGLASSHPDFTASTFMILAQLVSKIRLTPRIFTELFNKVCKSDAGYLRVEATLVLVVMTQSGRTPPLLPSVCHLATTAWFRPSLSQLAASGVVVFPLVAAIVTDSLTAMKNSDNVHQDVLQKFVSDLLKDLSFNDDEAGKLLKLFAGTPLSSSNWYRATLHQLEKSYPETFDKAVKCHPSLLGLVPGYTERNDLLQRLTHPESSVREQAVLHLKTQKHLLKEEWVREVLSNLLTDDSSKVLVALLDVTKSCSLPRDQLCDLAARCWHSPHSRPLAPLVLSHLITQDTDPTLMLLLTLPFLLPSDQEGLATANAVLKCAAVKKFILLQPLFEDLNNQITESRLSETVYKFIGRSVKNVSMEDVMKAGETLAVRGTVYRLLALLVAAGTLPERLTSTDAAPLLRCLSHYNTSSQMSSDIRKELNEKHIASIVSSCRSGKLPFQGSLYVLSVMMSRMTSPLPDNKYIYDITEPSIALVIDIFRHVLQMKNSENTYICKVYTNFCSEMFKKYCGNVEGQLTLLSNIVLGYPEMMGESMALVQQLVEVDGWAVEVECVLVPALLVALHSPVSQVRDNALSVLNSLTRRLALPIYHHLLHHLSEHSEEIAVDHEQVNVALYLCLSPDPSVQSLLSKPLQQEMASVLNSLVDLITAPDTPPYMAAAILQTLDQVNSQSLLERLVPAALRALRRDKCKTPEDLSVVGSVVRRVNPSTAPVLCNPLVWGLIEGCMTDRAQQLPLLLFNQVDRDFFAELGASLQERLLSLVVACAAETEDSEISAAIASCFKRIVLDATVLASLLLPMRDVTVDTPSQSKKRGWSVKKPPPLELLTSTPWRRGLCLLEFIQNKKKLDNVQVLVPRLFEILNRCLQFEEQSAVEYTKQVLLTSLLHCCTRLVPGTDLPQASVHVELVVECIRVSPNPQTHHHALLLLAHIADMFPNQVLHAIMPIFTFMGSSLLRQDDAYSFQIISKIIETIVPVLLKNEEEEQEFTREVIEVLRVFAGALLDIPEHRRIPLFTKLLETLQQGHFLWTFLCLVFESHVLHPTTDNSTGVFRVPTKESGSIPRRLEVALQLCCQFPPATVLASSCQLLRFLCALPIDKGDKMLEKFKKSNLGQLLNVERITDKQLRHYKYTMLTFLSLLLSSKPFLTLIAALTLEEMQELKAVFQQIIESNLTLTQTVSKQVDSTVGQVTAKYWKSMFNICFDVLAKTNALLPADMFLSVTSSLLEHELTSLRCKTLELLNWRLQQGQPMDSAQLLSLLPSLLHLVKSGVSSEADVQVTQQTALLSIKFLSRQLAADHPQEFQQVLTVVTKLLKKKKSPCELVLASALLCVGELSHSLGAHAMASLPIFMPRIIAILENHRLVGSVDMVLISCVSALLKIVDSLALFLSPYMSSILLHLSVLSAECTQYNDNPKLQPVIQKVKIIRQKISSEVAIRVLLPAVSESYSQLITTSRTSAVPPLLSLLADSFQSGLNLTPDLSTFFLTALDFRSQSSSPVDVDAVEPAVISTIVALVLKLSESSFRPFYYKIFNWAFHSDAPKDRSITFYKLTCSAAECLKGLFVSFAHYFLKNAALLLDENNSSKGQVSWTTWKALELVDSVLKTLLTVLLHDASHFLSKERFETLMQPLVDQLENEVGGQEELERRTTTLLVPCLSQMAVSAVDDTLWKQLNYQILLKTRHHISKVRIGAVLTVCEIAKKLGEEFLPLLPETVPFLAELLEDEDENVEKTCQRVVQELEAALGEPISKYF